MGEKKSYDTTLARIAGNVAAGFVSGRNMQREGDQSDVRELERVADLSVELAEKIVGRCEDLAARREK